MGGAYHFVEDRYLSLAKDLPELPQWVRTEMQKPEEYRATLSKKTKVPVATASAGASAEASATATTTRKCTLEELKTIVGRLPDQLASSGRQEWWNIVAAIVNTCKENNYPDEAMALCHAFSKKGGASYDAEGVEREVTDLLQRPAPANALSVGTLVYLACPQSSNYDTVKEGFEIYNCKIRKPTMYVVKDQHTGDLSFKSKGDFHHLYDALFFNINESKMGKEVPYSFTKVWFTDAKKREYANTDFLPPPLVCPPYTFNTWQGFRAEEELQPLDEEVDLTDIFYHINILVNHDEACYEYMLNFLAHRLQKPGELIRVCLLIRSDQGTGKGLFFNEFFGNGIIGRHYLHCTSVEKLFGRFSDGATNKVLVLFEEVNKSQASKHTDAIKQLITDGGIQYEIKGVQGLVTARNCSASIFLTNYTTSLHIQEGDRRHVVFDVDPKHCKDKAYVQRCLKWVYSDLHRRAFYEYLKNRDISQFNPEAFPTTIGKVSLMYEGAAVELKFLYKLMAKYKGNDENLSKKGANKGAFKLMAGEVFDDYLNFFQGNKAARTDQLPKKGELKASLLRIGVTAGGTMKMEFDGKTVTTSVNYVKTSGHHHYFFQRDVLLKYLESKGCKEPVHEMEEKEAAEVPEGVPTSGPKPFEGLITKV